MSNVEIIKSIYAAFEHRDQAAILKLISPDVRIEQSTALPWGGSYAGHAGLRDFFTKLLTHLDSHLTLERYLDAGDHVVAIGWTSGTVRATGKPFHVPIAHVWQVRDGKAVSFRPYIDNPTMLASMAK